MLIAIFTEIFETKALTKILHINNTAGGEDDASQLIDAISDILIEGDDASYVAAAFGLSRVAGVRTFHIGNTLDRAVHRWITRLTDAHGFQSVRATGRLIDYMMDVRPDLVHVHNMHGYYIHVGLLMDFLRRTRRPVVLTLHDYWAMTGHCVDPRPVGCDAFVKGECDKCRLQKVYPESWRDNSRRNLKAKRKALEEMDNLFIAVESEAEAEVVRESWLGGHPIFVVDGNNRAEKNGNFATANVHDKAAAYLEIYKNLV